MCKSKVLIRLDANNVLRLNPYLTNGFSHHYQLGESTFIFRGVRSKFQFLSHFSMKFLQANRIVLDENKASHPRLLCLPMSHKRDLCPIKGTPG